MNFPLTEFRSNQSALRRPTRFRAMVEVLDSRQLMAAGLTGAPVAVTGTAGAPLRVVEGAAGSVGIGGFSAPLEPIGSPIPLVLLTASTSGTLAATGFSGTVNWGDGSATDAASFGTNPGLSFTSINPNQLYANGPEHTYATAGTYTIIVSVTGPGDATPTSYQTTATIALPITGQLSSPLATGNPPTSNLSATTTPSFTGTTAPGATVILSATSSSTNQTVVVGGGVADASGVWNITTIPFVDGSYAISAAVTDAAGNKGSLTIFNLLPFVANPLVISTDVPTITSFQVTNAKTGAFQVAYSDPSDLALAGITDPSNYTVTRPSPAVKKGQKLAVTALTVSYAPGVELVSGTLSTVKPLLTKNGTYTYTIHSAGITSLAGKALDGEYTGKFPTGNGQAGGDFQVKVTVKNGKAAASVAIKPVKVVQLGKVKAASQHHA